MINPRCQSFQVLESRTQERRSAFPSRGSQAVPLEHRKLLAEGQVLQSNLPNSAGQTRRRTSEQNSANMKSSVRARGWGSQQFPLEPSLGEAQVSGGEKPHRFLIHDRDSVNSSEFDSALRAMGSDHLENALPSSLSERLLRTVGRNHPPNRASFRPYHELIKQRKALGFDLSPSTALRGPA